MPETNGSVSFWALTLRFGRKVAIHQQRCWDLSAATNLFANERDWRILFRHRRIVFALQFAVLQTASGIDGGCLNLDRQNAGRFVRGVKVTVASHLSNLPAIVVDAFTWNLIEFSTGVIRKTGACARQSAR